MDFDPSFLDAIKGFEGFSPAATWDYKQWTNGYGTRASGPNETIDQGTAEQRLKDELGKAAGQVDAIGVDMPAGARNALISLTYNAGPGWIKSGLGDLVRAGDWNGAAQRLQDYNKAGGEVNAGLAKRRATEAAWITGGQPAQSNPNGLLGANAVARAQPAPLPLFGGASAPSQPQPTFAGLPAPSSPGASGEGAGGGDLSSLLAVQAPQPPPLLPAWRPATRIAALIARFPNLRRG